MFRPDVVTITLIKEFVLSKFNSVCDTTVDYCHVYFFVLCLTTIPITEKRIAQNAGAILNNELEGLRKEMIAE